MMLIVLVVAALAAIYNLALASLAWQDSVVGLILATTLVLTYRRAILPASLPEAGHVLHIIVFLPKFLAMLVMDILSGTWLVATYVIGLRELEHPGIVRVPLGNHSRAGVGVVGLFVTISPGSFLVDIDWENRAMLVHCIDASDPSKIREDIEKYYRLWEYGSHLPDALADDLEGTS